MPRSTVHGGVTHGRQETAGTLSLSDRRARAIADAQVASGEEEERVVRIPPDNGSTDEWRAFIRQQHAPDFPGDVERAGRDELRDWFHGTETPAGSGR